MKQKILTLTSILLLTACGAGSGSSANSESNQSAQSTNQPTNQPVSKSDNLNKKEEPKKEEKPKGPSEWKQMYNPNGTLLHGAVMDVASFGSSKIRSDIDTTDEINTIKIADKEIELIPEKEQSENGLYSKEEFWGEKTVSGKKYKYIRFGILKEDPVNTRAFSHGLVTPEKNIPDNVIAKYEGDYILNFAGGETNYKNKFGADLNFSKKRFDIEYNLGRKIGSNKDETLQILDGTIDKNKLEFSGYGFNKKKEIVSNIELKGHIFGEKYQEVGGVVSIVMKDKAENIVISFGGQKVSEKEVKK